MRAVVLLALVVALPAQAQVYRWTDAKGTVHYSNAEPPVQIRATRLDIEAKAGPAAPDTLECHTVRCQGERMEERLARREVLDARLTAERIALAPPPVRGLEFRRYISIQRGMTEGELLSVAGEPDLRSRERDRLTYTYMPTVADPWVTTVTLQRGRVAELERNRK